MSIHFSDFFKKLLIIFGNAENKDMHLKTGEYLTVRDMAAILGTDPSAVKMRLHRAGINPLAKDALYPSSALDAIRDVPGRGRPKKGK
jgi:hypothetical protein